MIRDSDGYTYATLADRLLGEPEKTTRNDNIRCYRSYGYSEEACRAYAEGFDSVCPEGDPGPSEAFGRAHAAGLSHATATGGFHPSPNRR